MSLVDGPSAEKVYVVSHNLDCATQRGAPYCDCKPIPVGVKADQGKPRLGLVLVEVPHAFEKLGTLLGFGADKYAVGNWDKVPEGEMRYLDALMRHLTQHHKGEKVDPESGELHLAHAA
ncbi:dATP/dGTP diphosphohydrolase domain-containing protein, partial [Enterobacter hormaechei]